MREQATNTQKFLQVNWQLALLFFVVIWFHITLFFQFEQLNIIITTVVMLLIILTRTRHLFPLIILFWFSSLNKYLLIGGLKNLPAVSFLIPLFFSTLLILPDREARKMLNWLKFGKIDKISRWLIGLTSFFSIAALIVWAFGSDNLGAGAQMVQGFIQYPGWLIIGLGIPLFALFNALAEEFYFRGVFQTALDSVSLQKTWVIFLQATVFAAAHFTAGFPNGLMGYLMVLVYGVMLGYLKERTSGIFAPYLARVVADLTIGYFLYFYAIQNLL
jgi:membrane protease YdiL (CAAX protease family)